MVITSGRASSKVCLNYLWTLTSFFLFSFFKYSLCVMGDSPRQVFTPRQRHKLKEFAVRYAPNFKFRSRLTIT